VLGRGGSLDSLDGFGVAIAVPGTVAAPVLGFVVDILGFTRLVFVLRLDQVGSVEEGTFLGTDIQERSLNTGKDCFYFAEVDVPDGTPGIGTVDQEFNKTVVLENRHAGFPLAS
jgi:hypothetical protein